MRDERSCIAGSSITWVFQRPTTNTAFDFDLEARSKILRIIYSLNCAHTSRSACSMN